MLAPYALSTGPQAEQPIAVYNLKASSLDRLQEFLMKGEKRKAYHYAMDEKMWAHALLLASSMDQDSWKEAVQEFLRSELLPPPGASVTSNGRESLRVLYSLLSGQGAASSE